MKNTIVKDTIAITLITLAAGLALGFVQDITAVPIAEQQKKAKEEAYAAVFEDAASFGQVELTEEQAETMDSALAADGFGAQDIDEVMEAQDGSGNVLGYAFTVTTSEGYGRDPERHFHPFHR